MCPLREVRLRTVCGQLGEKHLEPTLVTKLAANGGEIPAFRCAILSLLSFSRGTVVSEADEVPGKCSCDI